MLPEQEPCDFNQTDYAVLQLCAGASDDGQFIYDAVYDVQAAWFVLMALHINPEWGFVESEKRVMLATRAELLAQIAQIEAAPLHWLEN